MKQRLLVAAIGVPLLLVVLLALPPVATAVLICAIAGAAAYELLHTAAKKPQKLYILTIVFAVLTAAYPFYLTQGGKDTLIAKLYPFLAFLYLAALCLIAVVTHGKEDAVPFADVAVAVVAAFVFPLMYSCVTLLREISPAFVLMPFVVAFVGDSASMLGGMACGKKKLAPFVSPNKTVAGFLFGPVGSAIGMVVLGLVARAAWQMELPLWYLSVIGVVANVFGQLGDLTTSLIKREAGIKDYSRIFLEHGGVLDRFDSTLFLAPVVYGMILCMGAAV